MFVSVRGKSGPSNTNALRYPSALCAKTTVGDEISTLLETEVHGQRFVEDVLAACFGNCSEI